MLSLRSSFSVARLCSFSRVVKFLPVSPPSGLAVGAFDLINLASLLYFILLCNAPVNTGKEFQKWIRHNLHRTQIEKD